MRKPSLQKSFLHALNGIFLMLSERNFKLECLAFVVNLILIFYLKLSNIDSILIVTVSFGVLVAEIFNTAIEKICDFIQPDFDPKIGFIKDISAGAVVLMAILSVIIGFVVYWKYIFL
ncbi:diacylglycerol kinase family protein [Chryseobacterium oryzae]|uniref:Diacylglycerol kinase family protein n=1 Tax=Chryseobacterium oryzae TaxID=2929799 RepID=A0ABY4BN36_9FLAO|nr:diacylglycerol kinase family protein [Chryseobacterium oryzae]UOE39133.1 diacylglycerol kinase family protein [Chryseobacterium oryzae]